MPDIADLAIKLSANSAGLIAGLVAGERQLKQFQASVVSMQAVATRNVQVFEVMWSSVSGGVEQTRQLANLTGVATEQLVGMGLALRGAGVDAGRLQPLLLSLQATLTNASLGNRFAQQSLAMAGVFGRSDLAGGFLQSVRSLENMDDPARRAALAFRLFGENASAALGLVAQGSDSLALAQARADRLGLSFSRFDAEGIRRANESLARMQDIFDGLTRSLIVQLAPYVDHMAASFERWVNSTGGLRNVMSSMVSTLIEGFAHILDSAQQLRDIIGAIRHPGTAAGNWLTSLIPQNFTEFLVGTSSRPQAPGSAGGDWLRNLDRPNPFLVGPPSPHAGSGILGQNIAQQSQVALNSLMPLFQQGAALAQQFRDPFHAFTEEMTRFQRMLDVGSIDESIYTRASASSVSRLIGNETSIPQLAGAATINSSAAGSAIAQFSAGFFDPMDTIARLQEQQVAQQQALNTLSERILQNLRNLNEAQDISTA